MDVRSLSSLRVGSLLWQPRPPTWELTVVCKATFALKPGASVLADEQEAINEHDDHWDDDPARGVRAPSDLLPGKLRADVTLVGNAYAPAGKPVRSLTVRMLVGDVDKSIEVWCDRTFLPDGTLQEGPRFSRMRLTWERAAGGPGTMNPVGMRNDARDAYNRRLLPNLQPIGIHVSDIGDFIEPVGFGPIAATWPTRAERRAMPAMQGASQPESTDLAYFNAAPLDQQPETLRPNERIVLENLHPQHARLVTNLPGIKPAALVERGRSATSWLAMRPDTLWIDADRGIATLTWRGRLPLARPDEPGRVLVALEEPGRKMTFPEIMTLAMSALRTTPEIETESPVTVDDDDDPFASSTVTISGPIPEIPASSQGSVMPFKPVPPDAARGRATQQGPDAGLPFQRATSPAVPPAPASRPAAPTRPAQPSWASVPPASSPPPAPVTPSAPAVIAPPVPVPAPVIAPPVPVVAPQPAPVLVAPPAPVVAPAPAPVIAPPLPVAATATTPGLGVPAYVMPPSPVRPSQPEMARPESPWALGPGAVPPLPDSSASARDAASNASGGRGGVASKDPAEGGAVGASNEAAAAARPWTALRRDQAPVTPADDAAVKPVIVRELLQLVWFDPASVPRIRRVASWKKLLEELAKKPADKALDDPMAGKEAWEVEDRRELLEVLANGERIDGEGAQDAMQDAIRDDGKYAPPLALFACELETPFDEVSALKATVTVAAPLAGPSDEGLRTAVEAADKFLGRSNLESAPAAADGLSTQIREAVAREKKSIPEGTIDGQVERAMLAGRHYQKRDVLGDKHLRALVWLPDEQQPLVAYIPQVVANRLPLARRFKARLIAEIHPSQDPYEKRDEALRALALATISTVKKSKSEPRST